MTRKEINSKTLAIVRKEMLAEEAKLSDKMSDLGADSLDKVTIMIKLEKTFGISVSDQETEDFFEGKAPSVAEIARFVESRMQE